MANPRYERQATQRQRKSDLEVEKDRIGMKHILDNDESRYLLWRTIDLSPPLDAAGDFAARQITCELLEQVKAVDPKWVAIYLVERDEGRET